MMIYFIGFALIINIIWLLLIAFGRLNVGIAFGGQDPLKYCRNPNLTKCGGEAQHLEKLGIWNPLGLPNVQSSTSGAKTPHIGVFLVSLERS
jgi:hypothetical protein